MKKYMAQSDTLNTRQKIVSKSVAAVLQKQIGHYLDRNYDEDFFYKNIHNSELEKSLKDCLKTIQDMKEYEEGRKTKEDLHGRYVKLGDSVEEA